MVSFLGLISCNTFWMAVVGISVTVLLSNALYLSISRIVRRYSFNGEMVYSFYLIFRLLRWSFIIVSREVFCIMFKE